MWLVRAERKRARGREAAGTRGVVFGEVRMRRLMRWVMGVRKGIMRRVRGFIMIMGVEVGVDMVGVRDRSVGIGRCAVKVFRDYQLFRGLLTVTEALVQHSFFDDMTL
jgi:hypothetical protein